MQTLKEQYKREQLRKKLKLVEQNIDPLHRKILLEEFSAADAKKVVDALNSIEKFAGEYNLNSLVEASKNAAEDAVNLTGLGGAVKQKIASFKSFGQGLTKILSFATSLRKGFANLQTIIALVEKTEPIAEENRDKPLDEVASEQLMGRLRTAIKKGFQPKGLFGSLRGIPYLDDDALASEILANSWNNINGIVESPQSPAAAPPPVEKEDAEDAVAAAKGDEEAAQELASDEVEAAVGDEDRAAGGARIVDIAAVAKDSGVDKDAVDKVIAALSKQGVKIVA